LSLTKRTAYQQDIGLQEREKHGITELSRQLPLGVLLPGQNRRNKQEKEDWDERVVLGLYQNSSKLARERAESGWKQGFTDILSPKMHLVVSGIG
jgi:hypothetical protein